MADAITPPQLKLLRLISERSDLTRERLLGSPKIAEADLAYLLRMELVREERTGMRITHLGQQVLRRA